jgi:hypothetical protein
MAHHITRQFDHEKGKRRDKAHSPDYPDSLREEGDNFDRGGTHGNRITLADASSLGTAFRKSMAQDKETAAVVLNEKLRTLPLKLNGYIFCFKRQNDPYAELGIRVIFCSTG